jgi:thimet oligopeptidase
MQNPLIPDFNSNINFQEFTVEKIEEAVSQIIASSKQKLDIIINVPAENRTFENTMKAYDELIALFETTYSLVYLTGYVSPLAANREIALQKLPDLGKFANEISLNENLYLAIKGYSQTSECKLLNGFKLKFVKHTVEEFERNGFALPKEKREELKIVKDKLTDLGVAFSSNISQYKDQLIVNEQDIEGLPDDYKMARKSDNGFYSIDLSYPSYRPFMKLAKSDKARKELYVKFLNRASGTNPTILKEILIYRNKKKDILGFDTYAKYALDDKMAKLPDNVWKFENQLLENIRSKMKTDYNELVVIKKNLSNDKIVGNVYPWQSSYYNHILLKTKYNVDDELVKEYFELNNVIKGIFQLCEKMFGISFEEKTTANTWHHEVKSYNLLFDNKIRGIFYLDLFPRDDKYNHAAMFPIISGRSTKNGYQLPVASLVCNFPKPTKERPSLMPHNEVITMLHEFGHLLHHLLTEAELASQSGTSVCLDFVETPSQFMENLAWNYDVLGLFAFHYKTNEKLPKYLFNKMLEAQNVGSGISTSQQIFYGMLDMELHDKYNPDNEITISEIVKKLQNEITPFEYLDGTCFEASFGHLNGYAAGYYSYLWSKVFSEDIFSVFEEKGIFNPETGKKYIDCILSKGSSIDEEDQIKAFLGREPNQKAFLKSIGI